MATHPPPRRRTSRHTTPPIQHTPNDHHPTTPTRPRRRGVTTVHTGSPLHGSTEVRFRTLVDLMDSVDLGDGSVSAGSFGAWLRDIDAVLDGGADSVVPCGGCTACCESSQFVHVGPDDHAALAHIPPALLFPAPGLPPGHLLMGYDDRGRCPMLGDTGCSIYDHRPRTCRTYDCRVFAATGLESEDQPRIADRVVRWRFDDGDEHARAAVTAAASFLAQRADELFAADAVPRTAAHRAVAALRVRGAFAASHRPTVAAVQVELRRTSRR